MVNWRQWDLMDLFKEKDPENLPVFLAMSLPETTVEERLHFIWIVNPVHRLLDLVWSSQPGSIVCASYWVDAVWLARSTGASATSAENAGTERRTGEMHHTAKPVWNQSAAAILEGPVFVDNTTAACLLPLWEESQPMGSLVERWQKLRPVHPVTLETTEGRRWLCEPGFD